MKKLTLFSIAMLMAFMVLAGLSFGGVSAADETAPVSTGLHVIAAQSSVAVSGVSGQEIAFSPEDFERALNVKRVDYITFTKVPDEGVGTLYLGSEGVAVGKTVSRENLHKLAYAGAAEGISENKFSFTTGNGYEIECSVYMLKEQNYCPTAGKAGELYLDVSTYRNVSVYGELSGSDPDGDEIEFEVVSYPSSGYLVMIDAKNGEYRYTPSADYTGKDSFKYVVKDKYGNYSAASTVSIEINKTSLSSVLSDMGGNRAHAAAISMIENDIMSPKDNGGVLTFSPTSSISREDFLVMVMKAAGLNYTEAQQTGGGSAQINTGFADDADISSSAKGYVYLAKQKGYVSGEGECFYPKRDITAAEAAVMIDKIIGASAYVVNANASEMVFADHIDIPVWAESSIRNLNSIGVMADYSGYIYPDKALDRATAATMLEAVMKLVD